MRFGRFSGTHPTMGVQHGEAFRDLLQQCRQGLDDLSPDKRLSVDSLIPNFESVLSQVAPELIEEMQGIAQGSGLSYKDVLRLNFAEEVGAGNLGCSQFGLAAADGEAIMGKAEDHGFEGRTYVVTELHPERGYAQLHVGAANWVVSSGSGINEAGLCVGQSTLLITDRADGVPRLTMLRLVLERCATVSEAAELLRAETGGTLGTNFLMVDANGDMAVVERSPSRCVVRHPQNGAIWATNHPVNQQVRAVEKIIAGTEPDLERALARDASSRQRYGRLSALAREHSSRPGLTEAKDALESVIRSHGPGGMCQHGVMQTTWSVMMVPRSRELWLADGPPCQNPFQRSAFSGEGV